MIFQFSLLLFLNCLSEYLLNKIMLAKAVLEKQKSLYHAICAGFRIVWVFLGVWFAIAVPIFLIGLFILLFLNVIPYKNRRLLLNNFIMIIYLIYSTLMMIVIGIAGLLKFNVANMVQDITMHVTIMNVAFMLFISLCIVLLYYHPEFLLEENYDKSKVLIYTHFLFICIIYHILDAVILTLYKANWINYLLLVSGDALILILIFHFLNYNYIFAKSEEMRKEYEESEVIIAQQFFEKESLRKLSECDSLTNTYNRREISCLMQKSIQDGHQLVCVFIDLDGLKRINDLYGHSFGDSMLKRFADACAKILYEKGYLARIGGDEFLLIFPDQEISVIETLIKDLQLKLLEPTDEKEKVYFSYGISYGEQTVEDFIFQADQRMYIDKNRKRSGTI